MPQRLWLEHFSEQFGTVEVNNAFYRLPERTTFEDWRDRTPADFCIAVKTSRYLTHIKRLSDPAEPVARFLDRRTDSATSSVRSCCSCRRTLRLTRICSTAR